MKLRNIIYSCLALCLVSNSVLAAEDTKTTPANAEMRKFDVDVTNLIKLWYGTWFLDKYVPYHSSILYDQPSGGSQIVDFKGFDLCKVGEKPDNILDAAKTSFVAINDFEIPGGSMSMIHSTGINNGNSTINYASPTMAITKMTAVSTAITTGWELGYALEASMTFKTPIGPEKSAKISVNNKYSGSKNVTQTVTDSTMYTAMSQNIPIPQHSKRTITQFINTGSATGTYTTYTPVDPNKRIKVTVSDRGGCASGGKQLTGYFRLNDLLAYIAEKEPRYLPDFFTNKDGDGHQGWYITTKGRFSASGNDNAEVITVISQPQPLY